MENKNSTENIIKIIHSADIQVKTRKNNLEKITNIVLSNIEKELISSKADIYIISGDLFEYATPNDNERRLIYNHLTKVITFENLKEIIIINGNHDIIKTKKKEIYDNEIEVTPVSIYNSLISNLKNEYTKKIRFFDKTGNYPSNVFENINYISYCLEDDGNIWNPENPIFEGLGVEGKLNIALFHDMIKEFIDDEGLPIKKDRYNKLFSIQNFPDNTLVCAGDIHKFGKWSIPERNINFYYPGAPMQHTFGEGYYLTLSNTKFNVDFGTDINKDLLEHQIKDSKYLHTYNKQIDNSIIYLTINFKDGYLIDNFDNKLFEFQLIKFFEDYIFSDCKLLKIKVKSLNLLLTKENEIYTLLKTFEKFRNSKMDIEIDFEYDKITQTTSSIKIVNEIVSEKIVEIVGDKTPDNEDINVTDKIESIAEVLSSQNIDKLILSESQVIKLFNDVTLQYLKENKLDGDTELIDNINQLFSKELKEILNNSNSKRYNINLKNIKFNQFMGLGSNNIDLDILGLTRILGTNGIGKTTLYRIIRWCINGMIDENMKSNQTSKNNLLIFNKYKPENNIINVEFEIDVNNNPILIERVITRKWKTSATDENKISSDWINYVSSVDKQIKLTINKNKENEKILVGEQAEKSLLLWFGGNSSSSPINNITFLNQSKIENFLKKSNEELKEIILEYIGVDYIQKLENRLDDIKTNLLSITKPLYSLDELNIQITDINIKNKKEKEKLNDIVNNIDEKYNIFKQKRELYESKIEESLKFGDVDKMIEDKTFQLDEVTKAKNSFNFKEEKSIPIFDTKKPQSFTDSHEYIKFQTEIKNEKKNISDFESKIKSIKTNNIDNKINDFVVKFVENNLPKIDEEIENLKTKIDKLKVSNVNIVDKLIKVLNIKKNQLIERKNHSNTEIENYSKQISELNKKIKNLKTQLSSGVCTECNRPYSESWESIKLQLEVELINVADECTVLEELHTKETNRFKQLEGGIKKFDEEIIFYQKLLKNEEFVEIANLFNPETINKFRLKLYEYFENYEVEIYILDLVKNEEKISKYNNDIKNIEYEISVLNNTIYIKLQHLNYEDLSEENGILIHLKNELNSEICVKYYNIIVEFIKELKLSFDLINETQISLDKSNTRLANIEKQFENEKKYNLELLEHYTSELEKYNKEVSSIQDYNNSIVNHNLNFEKYLIQIENIEKSIIELKLQKPIYDNLKIEINDLSNESEKLSDEINELISDKGKINVELNSIDFKLERLNEMLEEAKIYKLNNLIWKIYSKLIKNSFKNIIFEYYRIFLNGTLHSLLRDCDFKLFFDNQNSELLMIEVKNGRKSFQQVRLSSGMETCFLGLALIYTIHLLNVKNTISHIFIDEISGTLNKGTDLTYDATNYQELLVEILNKFENKKIFIVDHNIKNLYENKRYEVNPSENGSIFNSLD